LHKFPLKYGCPFLQCFGGSVVEGRGGGVVGGVVRGGGGGVVGGVVWGGGVVGGGGGGVVGGVVAGVVGWVVGGGSGGIAGNVGGVVGGGGVVPSLPSPCMFPLSSHIFGLGASEPGVHPTGILHSGPLWSFVNC